MGQNIPDYALIALQKLENAGYEAYLVGGCVRDHLLGQQPKDYDITTSALPEQIKQVFEGERVIETGLKHGTVTVILRHQPLEITTFRVEQGYSDGRHPDTVRFTKHLKQDLARRDFTVNAMAYHPTRGVIDYFGGKQHLQNNLLCCVGEPSVRFEEDGLRILRALRFASTYGFCIEENTSEAIHKSKNNLKKISRERIFGELTRLLCGRYVRPILLEYVDVLGVFIPEILPMVDFEQHNVHHIYDVWRHTAAVVEAVPNTTVLRLAALFHDIGKPACFFMGTDGQGHFYGHDKTSASIAQQVLYNLCADNDTRNKVVELVRRHDAVIEAEEPRVRRALNKMGSDTFFELVSLKRADNKGQAPELAVRQIYYDRLERIAREILAQEQCFSLKDLAVKGGDVIAWGIEPGPKVGNCLKLLLDAVMDGLCENKKDALFAYWKSIAGKQSKV